MALSEQLSLAAIDDDEDVRVALPRPLRAMGHKVRVFGTADDFEADNATVNYVIVAVCLPGVSGLELRERLRNRNGEPHAY